MNTFSWTIWSSDPAKTRRFVPEGCTVTMRLLDDTIVAGYRFHARDPQHAFDDFCTECERDSEGPLCRECGAAIEAELNATAALGLR